MIAKMHCYNGMTYDIAEGSRKEVFESVKRFLKRREKYDCGPAVWYDPMNIECEDDGGSIGDYDGTIRIRAEKRSRT
jgi:hypothetical protein